MKNIIDYTKTELHTINIKEFNDVDSLILSQISYIVLDELIGSIDSDSPPITFKDLLRAEFFPKMFDTIPFSDQTKDLLFYLCSNPRFRDIKINYHITKTDPIFEKQFSATTFILNENLAYIAFRGTDRSVIGWKEDFNMAFTTPVPSQLEGVGYINKVSKLIPHNFYVGGHSKGGNIAVYASMFCDFEASPRIKKIYSHDGPGFREEVIKSDAFIKVQDKLSKTLPHSSLIGMLLENHEDYHVIKSNKIGGIGQHDPFSWEIEDSNFIYLENISHGSKYTCDTLHQWLKDIDDKKRKLFIDGLFDIFTSTKSEDFIEIFHDWKKNLPLIWDSVKHLDKEVKTMLLQLFKELSTLYIKTLTHTNK